MREWNTAHDQPASPVATNMPANARPSQWRNDILGTFVNAIPVRMAEDLPDDWDTVLAFVTSTTRQAKQEGLYTGVPELLWPLGALPRTWKGTFRRWLTTGAATVGLSNLGVLDLTGLPVDALWFSPPTCATSGIAIGVAKANGRLTICARFRRDRFSDTGAAAFVDHYRRTLLGENTMPS
ncbi:hypothetical protein [Nocardia sp. NPDC049149]|uniref:hypothetical protein n=1 Tax=Nocardia sp. NPDC049149 TaxID=3364315 RepID=UPI003718B0F7